MALIIPSVLEVNLLGFERKMNEIIKFPNLKAVQIDISDGIFTAKKTINLSDLDVLNPVFFWEAHLMVKNPQEYFLDAKILGFNRVIFHYEAVEKDEIPKLVKELKEYKISPGLAVNIETSVDEIADSIDYFDEIVLMSIKPGAQNQEFISEVYEKISKLKSLDKKVIIEVDGGIKLDIVEKLCSLGAENLAVGSHLFSSDESEEMSPQRRFEQFEIETQNS